MWYIVIMVEYKLQSSSVSNVVAKVAFPSWLVLYRRSYGIFHVNK